MPASIPQIFLLIALLATGCTSETTSSRQQKDVSAITSVSKARAAAFNNSNAAAIAEHFTAEAILMAPGKPATIGKEAVCAYYQSIFDKYVPELDSHYEEVEVAGDLAYGRGVATVRLTPKEGGESTTSTAKYLNILKRQADGSWKTTHDIWNSNEEVE